MRLHEAALCAVLLASGVTAGCYESFVLEDATPREAGHPRDAGTDDIGPADADVTPLDGGPCRTARGAELCSQGSLARVCPFDRCACVSQHPDRPGEREGFCATYPPMVSGVGYNAPGPCTGGMLGLAADPAGGLCAVPEACAEVVFRGWPWRCFYGDGTEYRTGLVRSEPCPGLDDVVCGPGCGGCASGSECMGPSEASGLGVCLPVVEVFFYDFEYCGTTPPGEEFFCAPGLRCLRFATPQSPFLLGDPPGLCMEPARCERIAAGLPERFECMP